MTDPLDRLIAYGTAPEVYSQPTPDECLAAAAEIERLRAANKQLRMEVELLVHDLKYTGEDR